VSIQDSVSADAGGLKLSPRPYHLLKMGALAPQNYYKNWVSFCFGCGICRSV